MFYICMYLKFVANYFNNCFFIISIYLLYQLICCSPERKHLDVPLTIKTFYDCLFCICFVSGWSAAVNLIWIVLLNATYWTSCIRTWCICLWTNWKGILCGRVPWGAYLRTWTGQAAEKVHRKANCFPIWF